MKRKKQELEKITDMKNNIKKKVVVPFFLVIAIIIFTIVVLILMSKFNLNNKNYYKASDFKIKTIYSKNDKDKDSIDDYTDILLGAKKLINKNITDAELLTKSLKNAGYDIEDDLLPYIKDNSIELTTDCYEIKEFQPGDIIIYEDNKIGIISDKRNEEGISYMIYVDEKVVDNDILELVDINEHYRLN